MPRVIKPRKDRPPVTYKMICEIRERYARREGSQHSLARRFGVSQQLVGQLVSGKKLTGKLAAVEEAGFWQNRMATGEE